MQKKKVLTMALAGMMVLTLPAVPAAAASSVVPPPISSYVIAPRWVSTTVVVPSISNSGRDISVSLLITPKKSAEKSSGTLYLEQYSGDRWKSVKSWSISKKGTVDMTKSYSGKSGIRYRTKAVVTTGSDKITAASSEITIN